MYAKLSSLLCMYIYSKMVYDSFLPHITRWICIFFSSDTLQKSSKPYISQFWFWFLPSFHIYIFFHWKTLDEREVIWYNHFNKDFCLILFFAVCFSFVVHKFTTYFCNIWEGTWGMKEHLLATSFANKEAV